MKPSKRRKGRVNPTQTSQSIPSQGPVSKHLNTGKVVDRKVMLCKDKHDLVDLQL